MKIKTLLLSGFLIAFLISCKSTNNSSNPEKWSDKQVSTWFNQKEWLGQTELQVDSSLNKREFAVQYIKNKERWDRAFNFLKHEDLAATSVGTHELDSQNVFVKVTEYYTKDPAMVLFEAHRNYSDIQYVISGTEFIQLAPTASVTSKIPYDSAKDIEFFEAKDIKSLPAKPGTFFIIFPTEVHRPSIMDNDSIWVKKIVIKVRNL